LPGYRISPWVGGFVPSVDRSFPRFPDQEGIHHGPTEAIEFAHLHYAATTVFKRWLNEAKAGNSVRGEGLGLVLGNGGSSQGRHMPRDRIALFPGSTRIVSRLPNHVHESRRVLQNCMPHPRRRHRPRNASHTTFTGCQSAYACRCIHRQGLDSPSAIDEQTQITAFNDFIVSYHRSDMRMVLYSKRDLTFLRLQFPSGRLIPGSSIFTHHHIGASMRTLSVRSIC
jgi:hypothetical protein